MSETVITTITSIGGGFFAGIMLGYFVRKIIKILIFIGGSIVGLLLYLQHEQIISVNFEELENSLGLILSSLPSFDNITQIANATSLGIPLAGGLSAGFVVGFMKG
jgi:uncharacterized membrane protein (Fun14 family)